MRMFIYLLMAVLLFNQNQAKAQVVSGVASIDFATANITPINSPSYSAQIVLDDDHKINILCTRQESNSVGPIQAECIKNADGSLALTNYTWLPFESRRAVVYFDPPAVAVSGIITGQIGDSSVSTINTLKVTVDNSIILSQNNLEQIFTYPFSYVGPEGVRLIQINGFFSPNIGGRIGDPNAFLKIGLKTLSWITKPEPKLDISISPDFKVTSSTTTGNNKFAVRPNVPVTLSFALDVKGRKAIEDRTANVSLFVGNREPVIQTIPISSFSADGKLNINFNITFSLDDIGPPQSIQLVVDQSDDINTLNNVFADYMYIGCKIEKDVPHFLQGSGTSWAADKYAFTNKAMGAKGCYTTSFAMLMKYYGINKSYTGEDINPGIVNTGLVNISEYKKIPQITKYLGYNADSDVEPLGAVNYARTSYATQCISEGASESSCVKKSASKISYIDRFDFDAKKPEQSFKNVFSEISKNICADNPVILKVKSVLYPNNPRANHFVLATGMAVGDDGKPRLITNDPARIKGRLLDIEDVRGVRIYKQIADPSMIYMSVGGGLDMVITEPDGKRVGINSLTEQQFDENPNSNYISREAIGTFEEPTESELSSDYINKNAIAGNYQVEVFNNKNTTEKYSVIKNSYDENGEVNQMNEYAGELLPGQSAVIKTSHKTIPYVLANLVNLTIKQALYLDKSRKDKAFITGNIAKSDGSQLPTLDKEVVINIGSITKKIPLRHFQKLFLNKNTLIYSYANWNKREVVFQINIKTGDFLLYFDNINLDDAKPALTVNLKISFDTVEAQTFVTFKNIRRRSHGF